MLLKLLLVCALLSPPITHAAQQYALLKQFALPTSCDNSVTSTTNFAQLVLMRVNECAFFDNLRVFYIDYNPDLQDGTVTFYSNYRSSGCAQIQVFQVNNATTKIQNLERLCNNQYQIIISESLELLWNAFQVSQWISTDSVLKVCYTNDTSCAGHMNNMVVQYPFRSCSTIGDYQSDFCHALGVEDMVVQSQCMASFNVSDFSQYFGVSSEVTGSFDSTTDTLLNTDTSSADQGSNIGGRGHTMMFIWCLVISMMLLVFS